MSETFKKEDLDLVIHDLRSVKSALKMCQDIASELPKSKNEMEKILRLAFEKMERHLQRFEKMR